MKYIEDKVEVDMLDLCYDCNFNSCPARNFIEKNNGKDDLEIIIKNCKKFEEKKDGN